MTEFETRILVASQHLVAATWMLVVLAALRLLVAAVALVERTK